MSEFQIPERWQTPIAAILALVLIVLVALVVRAFRAAPTAIETPVVQVSTPRPRPTAPPTFTTTPSPTVPASPTATFTPSPTPTYTPTPLPTPIVVDITELGYLTSVQYKMQTIVTEKRTTENWWEQILGDDRVVMRVVGKVQAGINLSTISDKDIQISGDRILLNLPHATISSVELLPDESEVIDSQHRIAFSNFPGLETDALDSARTQLKNWAEVEAGILPVAERLAKLQLTEFLQNLGFKTITITFTDKD